VTNGKGTSELLDEYEERYGKSRQRRAPYWESSRLLSPLGPFVGFAVTSCQILLRPGETFRRMPLGGQLRPVSYALICSAFCAISIWA
jgi:hypothetical protein